MTDKNKDPKHKTVAKFISGFLFGTLIADLTGWINLVLAAGITLAVNPNLLQQKPRK